MKVVNFQKYPKFWKAFSKCLAIHDDLNTRMTSSTRTHYILIEHFDLTVYVPLRTDFTYVEMSDEAYTMFVLKWV